MPLRNRKEIEARISELTAEAEAVYGKNMKLTLANIAFFFLYVAMFAIAAIFLDSHTAIYVMLIGAAMYLGYLATSYFGMFLAGKWGGNFNRKIIMTFILREILILMEKPYAEKMIKNQFEMHRKYLGKIGHRRIFDADSKKNTYLYLDATVQAYAWVVSPGMDFRDKPA